VTQPILRNTLQARSNRKFDGARSVAEKVRDEKWLTDWPDDMLLESFGTPGTANFGGLLPLKHGVCVAKRPTFNACKTPRKAIDRDVLTRVCTLEIRG